MIMFTYHSWLNRFIVMQYNDNNGNPYSDVFWLAELVQSIGELEFGQQVCSFCHNDNNGNPYC